MSFISVVIPIYNDNTQLRNAINSVLLQSCIEFELVIVDDASTEDISGVLSWMDDKRARIIRLDENKGPSGARNAGVREAKGDIIAFQDSDDIWKPDKLMKQMGALDDSTGMVFCSYEIEELKDRISLYPSVMGRELSSEEISSTLNERNLAGTPTMLVRKELFEKIGGFDEDLRGLEDWDLAIRLSKQSKVKFINEPLVYASYSVGGVNHNSSRIIDSAIKMMRKHASNGRLIKSLLGVVLMNLSNAGESFDKIGCLNTISDLVAGKLSNLQVMSEYMGMSVELRKMNRIMALLCSDECIERIIREHDLNGTAVGIYGCGVIGMACVDRLASHGVRISCIIDANVTRYKKHKVAKISDVNNDYKMKVIVTVIKNTSEVIRNAMHYLEAEYIAIEEMVCPDGCTGIPI